MMKKVLKFVKGKRDERKDYASSNTGFNSNDQCAKQSVTRPTEEASTTIEHACGYSVDVNGKDKSLTKLHKVTWQGNLEKVKAAIKKTDIDIRDRSNRTALHLAAARGHAHVVYFLVNNKANVNIRDSDGKVPLLKVALGLATKLVSVWAIGTPAIPSHLMTHLPHHTAMLSEWEQWNNQLQSCYFKWQNHRL